MGCLSGIVGLKCSKTGPDQGVKYYLSELPGIFLSGATQIADHEQGTGEAMLRESIAFAEKMVAEDFAQLLQSKNLALQEVISTVVAGNHGDNFQGAIAGTKGVFVGLNDPNDPYLVGTLNYLEMKVQAAVVGVTIEIYIDGVLDTTLTADLVAGINNIPLGIQFRQSAQVEIDMTGILLSDGESIYGDRSCISCDDCGPCLFFKATSNGSILVSGGALAGLVISASCGGSLDAIVCAFRNALGRAILYRAGAHVMESLIMSPRPNPYVRNTKEDAKALLTRWMGGTDLETGFPVKGEYPRAIIQVVNASFQSLLHANSRVFGSTGVRAVSSVTPAYNPRQKMRQKNFSKRSKFYY